MKCCLKRNFLWQCNDIVTCFHHNMNKPKFNFRLKINKKHQPNPKFCHKFRYEHKLVVSHNKL